LGRRDYVELQNNLINLQALITILLRWPETDLNSQHKRTIVKTFELLQQLNKEID
jgi:hypothetical protein